MCKPINNLKDRGDLVTESRLAASEHLDTLSIRNCLQLINDEDLRVAPALNAAIPAISQLTDDIVRSMKTGGRLIYLGAGTSGRLGVLDASECPPTFRSAPDQVVGLIAGGDKALRNSSETAEDDLQGAQVELDRLSVGPNDTVVGIAAGGTTPYVLGGLTLAKHRGAITALLSCIQLTGTSKEPPVQIDHVIELAVGPEVLTGSTRMKSGTATKMALNMITTTTMIQLGKVWGNLMVDLRATNHKLQDRAIRILCAQCDLTRHQAQKLLEKADGRVKIALVMTKRNVSSSAAQQLLNDHDQMLNPIIGVPRDDYKESSQAGSCNPQSNA